MELTTTQIAVLTNKSQRQVERWIAERRLPARHISGSLYEVSEGDLQPFLPPLERETAERMVERIESLENALSTISVRLDVLENRIEEQLSGSRLERQVEGRLSASRSTSRPSRPPPVGSADNIATDLVPVYQFYHNVPDSTGKRLLAAANVPIVRGHWVAMSGHHYDKALGIEGQALAYGVLRTHPRFQPCENCPHSAGGSIS